MGDSPLQMVDRPTPAVTSALRVSRWSDASDDDDLGHVRYEYCASAIVMRRRRVAETRVLANKENPNRADGRLDEISGPVCEARQMDQASLDSTLKPNRLRARRFVVVVLRPRSNTDGSSPVVLYHPPASSSQSGWWCRV